MNTPLEKYAEIQAMVQKEARDIAMSVYNEMGTKFGVSQVPLHSHNGIDSPRIPSTSISASFRTSGNITMATDGATYRIANPFNASQVLFYGIASRAPGGTVDIRVNLFGAAQLGRSYYLAPQSSTSVTVAEHPQKVVQSGSFFLVTTGGAVVPQYRARSTETTLCNVDWPTSNDIVARAEIVDFGNGYIDVLVNLGTDWTISANFMVT